MFKVKGQRSRSQGQRSRRKVMYQQQIRYNTAMDRFSDVKLGMASYLKRERTGVARAASSCNAFAIVTFSSYISAAPLYFIIWANHPETCQNYGVMVPTTTPFLPPHQCTLVTAAGRRHLRLLTIEHACAEDHATSSVTSVLRPPGHRYGSLQSA